MTNRIQTLIYRLLQLKKQVNLMIFKKEREVVLLITIGGYPEVLLTRASTVTWSPHKIRQHATTEDLQGIIRSYEFLNNCDLTKWNYYLYLMGQHGSITKGMRDLHLFNLHHYWICIVLKTQEYANWEYYFRSF